MKLTPLAKLFISVVILAVIGYVVWIKVYKQHGTLVPGEVTTEDPIKKPTSAGGPSSGKSDRIVIGVNDFGGAYPLLLANDGAKAGPQSLFSKAGLDVEIKLDYLPKMHSATAQACAAEAA